MTTQRRTIPGLQRVTFRLTCRTVPSVLSIALGGYIGS
jgi:hypothetical protein